MKELYDKKVECPVCKVHFTTKKVRSSRLRLIKRDEDFLSHYHVENPIKYNAFVCPNCGYAGLEHKFDKISKEEAEEIVKNISSIWKQRDFGGIRTLDEAIESYKLALFASTFTVTSNLELGNICLNIAWLYRMREDEKEEIRFLAMARDKFIQAFNTESLAGTNMNDSKLSYLIGELSRRLNNKEEALSWFNTCIGMPETKMTPALDNMVREQWRVVREM